MSKKTKEIKPAEESLFLRMLWFALTFTCFYLIAIVDPKQASLGILGLNIALLFIYFWIAVIGSYLSYSYRHKTVKWLEFAGLAMVGLSCYCFANNIHNQMLGDGDIDLLLPTVHLVSGLYVSHSFELRTRFDFNFSLVISAIIVCFTATLGKGAWFGLGMFVYVALAATLLLLDCEARTFGTVQARIFDGAESYLTFSRRAGSSERTANLVVPTLALLLLSIAFFLVIPRAESLADQIAARAYAFVRHKVTVSSAPTDPRIKLVHLPFRRKRNAGLANDLAVNHNSQNQIKERELKNDLSSLICKDNERPNNTANRHLARNKPKPHSNTSTNATTATVAAMPTVAATAKKLRLPYSRAAEKCKRERLAKAAATAGNSDSSSISASSVGTTNSRELAENLNKTDTKMSATKHGAKVFRNNQGQNSDYNSQKHSQSSAENSQQSSSTKSAKQVKHSSDSLNHTNNQGSKTQTQFKKNKIRPASSAHESAVYTMPDTLDTEQPASTEEIPIFNVDCNRTVNFRQGAFDNYDGRHWHISPDIALTKISRGTKGTFKLPHVFTLALPNSVPAIRLPQKFHILNNLGAKIIFAGSPSEVAYPGPDIQVDSCANLKGTWPLVKGLEYSVSSDEPIYDLEAMRKEVLPDDAAESSMQASLAKFLQIPDSQSEQLYDLSHNLAGVEDNWFVQAERISSYLRHNYKYSSESKYKAETANSTERFLFQSKIGDCKDFATAFVILCRASGIPARFVVGFSAGKFSPVTGLREVKLKDSHAWGEIYFPSSGWVPFDPTPQGLMPAKQHEQERYFTTIGQSFKSSLKSTKLSGDKGQEGQEGKVTKLHLPLPNGQALTIPIDLWGLLKLLPILLGAIVFFDPFVRAFNKFAKKLRWPKSMHPASKIYCSTLKDLKAIGVSSHDCQTPGEFLDKIKEKLASWDDLEKSKELADLVEEFISCYNATYFGERGNTSELVKARQRIRVLIKP